MLQYYLPGLDVSALDDRQFVNKVGQLLCIREMEKNNGIELVLKKILSSE